MKNRLICCSIFLVAGCSLFSLELANERFSHRDLLKGLYAIAQNAVAEHQPSYLVVAVDPVNFEKPYTERLEGVSTVMKSTPPPPKGQKKRLAPGYPAITRPADNVQKLYEDSTGTMWLGTYSGLNRYDGYDLKIYRHDPEDSGSLSDSHVWDVLEDSHGVL